MKFVVGAGVGQSPDIRLASKLVDRILFGMRNGATMLHTLKQAKRPIRKT